jgi:hypothetical protein
MFAATPRTDAPIRLPRPTRVSAIPPSGDPATRALNDLQVSLVQLAQAMEPELVPPKPVGEQPALAVAPTAEGIIDLTAMAAPIDMSEAEARQFVRRKLQP